MQIVNSSESAYTVDQYLTGKQFVIIDSSRRIEGSAEAFTVDLGRVYQNVRSITPLYMIFTNNIYNVP